MIKISMENNKTGISLSFQNIKKKNVLIKSVLDDDCVDIQEDDDYVTEITNNTVKSAKPKQIIDPFIIPLIQKNRWRTAIKPEDLEKCEVKSENNTIESEKLNSEICKDENNSIEQQAITEILAETKQANRDKDKLCFNNKPSSILSLAINKVPGGFESSEGILDVALRPDEPVESDYNNIPIDQFGLAMLRGMGWKEGGGIGKNGKVVNTINPILRPKGMGLGADKNLVLQNKKKTTCEKQTEKLEIRKGSFCNVIDGKYMDLYGIIQSIDEDNGRVVVKLALRSDLVTIPQFQITLVSSEEYEKYSKYLNKQKADKYKEMENNKNERARSRSPIDKMLDKSFIKTNKQIKKETFNNSNILKKESSCWLKKSLHVRIIDKRLRNGQFFKEKAVIIDLLSRKSCVCKTDDGHILENIHQNQLETVMPKSNDSCVMVVAGKYIGKLGQVMLRDKKTYTANIQLFSDRSQIHKMKFDDICEYYGNVEDDMDY